MKIIDDAVRSFKTVGALRTGQRAFQQIVPDHVFDINSVVFSQWAAEAILGEIRDTPLNPEFQHRWATEKDIDLLTCGGMTRDEVRKHFDAGGRAVLTTSTSGEMVGYYWAIPGPWINYGWIRYDVAADEFWGAHNFVVPSHRGKKIAWETRRFAFKQLFSEGYRRGTGAIQTLNRSSMRIWATPANRVLGHVFYVRLFINPPWRSPCALGGTRCYRPLVITVHKTLE